VKFVIARAISEEVGLMHGGLKMDMTKNGGAYGATDPPKKERLRREQTKQ